jgi:hypothetical protein
MLMQEQEKAVAISTAGTVAEPALVRGRVVRTKWARNVLTFLMVFGPGLIVMEADNCGCCCCFCLRVTSFRRW